MIVEAVCAGIGRRVPPSPRESAIWAREALAEFMGLCRLEADARANAFGLTIDTARAYAVADAIREDRLQVRGFDP